MGNTSKITTRDPIVPHLPVRMLMISGRGSKPLFSLLKEVYLSSNYPPLPYCEERCSRSFFSGIMETFFCIFGGEVLIMAEMAVY